MIVERCNLIIPFFNDFHEHVDLLFKFNHSVFTCIYDSNHNWHYIWMRHVSSFECSEEKICSSITGFSLIIIPPFGGLDSCSQMFFEISKHDISTNDRVSLERLRVFRCLSMLLGTLEVLPWDVMISLDVLQKKKRWKVEIVLLGVPNCSHEILKKCISWNWTLYIDKYCGYNL